MTINDLLDYTIEKKASDLHLTTGAPPIIRSGGVLVPVAGTHALKSEQVEEYVFPLLKPEQKEILLMNKEIDFSFAFGDKARFRINAYHQRGYLSAALRCIPYTIPTIDELGLPKIIYEFCKLPQGFILVTGPTGQGKSTTLAAIIDEINQTRPVHIVTIEDPIEYLFPNKKALVEQREMHLDTHAWDIALRSVLRQDPDVVLVGEMRDYETISSAVTVAETGHLVFATLHTNSAAQTIDRIVDVFPDHQQQQIRVQLSATLEGVISQRLIPSLGSGLVPAVEILLATPAVRSLIRDGKTHQIDNIIATSSDVGMISLERSLANLVNQGKISKESAVNRTLKPDMLERMIRQKGS
ncbi:type IV pili twitching motility protein PilT [candidate division WWE3 bacterium CG08_land_8_20_14_0_20_43_13]|uniref:Type IV pili twitching motility protein PilT n=1 Tax=candidate division WWE3 bacterium CG08_land_8_20_14_0_20_43_13 TaxID=1975087 RepID=A0A2H0X810_UNCKA|nr:MAG: type IV pili twitching motility protein PilT [candidate division WWE3 bacterium CG08_land_8_20_14_0_20_43_13]